jgi:hypothetical protein
LAYFVPIESVAFGDQLASLPPDDQLLIFEAIEKRLKYYPSSEKNPVRSHMLEDDLDCIRSIHIDSIHPTKLLLIAYTVCNECKGTKCVEKLACFYCWDEPAYTLKLIACGYHEGFYEDLERSWRSWINYTNRVRESGSLV